MRASVIGERVRGSYQRHFFPSFSFLSTFSFCISISVDFELDTALRLVYYFSILAAMFSPASNRLRDATATVRTRSPLGTPPLSASETNSYRPPTESPTLAPQDKLTHIFNAVRQQVCGRFCYSSLVNISPKHGYSSLLLDSTLGR